MTESVTIDIKYSRKDTFFACFHQYFNISSLFYSFFGFVIFANILTLLFYDFQKVNFAFLILCAFAYSTIWLLVLTHLSSQVGGKFFSYRFTDENLEYFNDDFHSKIKWTYIKSVKESFRLLNIVMKSGQTISIPISKVETEKVVKIKQLLKEKLGDNAKLKEPKNTLGLK
jgi:hypothetical protein